MKLHELKPAEGSKKNRKRVGRGNASGQGTYAGRGRKGQHARAGSGGHLYREGGNLPFVRKLPFARGVGFVSIFKTHYTPVNLDQLAAFTAGSEVTPDVLAEVGFIKSAKLPVADFGTGRAAPRADGQSASLFQVGPAKDRSCRRQGRGVAVREKRSRSAKGR